MLNAFKKIRERMAGERVLKTIEKSILQEPTHSEESISEESIKGAKEVIGTICDEFNGEKTKPTITERVLSPPYKSWHFFKGMFPTTQTEEIQPKPVTGVSILNSHEEFTTVLASRNKSKPSEKSVVDKLVRENKSATDLDNDSVDSLTIPVMSEKKTVLQRIRSFFTNIFSARTTESSDPVHMMYGDTSKHVNALEIDKYVPNNGIEGCPPLNGDTFERAETPPPSYKEATEGKAKTTPQTNWLHPQGGWKENVGTREERAKQNQEQQRS